MFVGLLYRGGGGGCHFLFDFRRGFFWEGGGLFWGVLFWGVCFSFLF